MCEHSHTGTAGRIWIGALLCTVLFAFGCSKSERTTSRHLPPEPSLAATSATPIATPVKTPHRRTAAERFVEIDRLLAMPPTGSPEQCDERTLLRAERAALISSGQVPYQSTNQSTGQPDQSSPATMMQHPADGDFTGRASATADPQNDQRVIATNSQASSLPFLEQMTPSERDHYFEELWLQNNSVLDVNVNRNGFALGRFGLHHRRPNMRHPGRAGMPLTSR